MKRYMDMFGQDLLSQTAAQTESLGALDLTVRSSTGKNLDQAGVRVIRLYDNALIFEGKTNAAGRLRIALPVCEHKTKEEYTITINYNGFPTKALNVLIIAGQTVSQTTIIG